MRSFPDLTDVGFSSRTIEPVGTGSSRVMLLGEAPGEFEDRFYSPFYGLAPAGALLSRMLRRAGLGGWNDVDGWKSSQFRILNVVWQRPPRNWLEGSPWETRAIEAWRPFVEEEIKRMNPRVIVALGGTALRFLTSYGGEGTGVTQVARYVLRSNYDAWCLPLEHPSFLLPRGAEEDQKGQANNMRLMGAGIFGLQRAVTIAKEGFERETLRYITHPSLDEMLAFERDYNPERHTLSYDIETPRSSHLDEEDREEEDPSYEIIRASMCYETARAISFPWCHPYADIARRLLAARGPKRVWNSPFDNPRLRANACEIGGRNYDVMEQWSHLQRTLPRGLGFVAPFYGWTLDPWKHESDANPEYYSCCDADALHRIGEGTTNDLRATGQWERYERHVVDTYEVLTLMSRNGLPYSQEEATKFQAELEKLQVERLELLQARVPESVRPSKQKQGLKREPINTNGYVKRTFRVLGKDLTDEECDYRGGSPGIALHDMYEVVRWCLVEPFLPTSSKQVLDLIKHFGHTPGTNRKSKKETSDEDTLRKLLKKYRTARKESDRDAAELYKLILECRQLSKVLGTYVKGWKPGKDGRIHSTPGFWGKMFRISWRRPNIAATIADKEEEYIAAGFRKCVRAPEGKVLLESDWKGIEAVLVGWFAGDESYMRLARLGVHDYMCCHLLVDRHKMAASNLPSLAWSDGDLKALFRDVKKRFPKDRDDAKHTVHGTNYGMTWKLLSELYGLTASDAKKLIALYFSLFPKVKEWQQNTLQRAYQEGRLTNPFGYSMWFWDVLKWNSRYQRMELGTDAKSAISFLPRDTAAAMLKEALLRLNAPPYDLASRGIMLSSTHDSILTEQLESQVEMIARVVKEEMERPVPELGGLVIGVEQKVGHTWDSEGMKTLKEATNETTSSIVGVGAHPGGVLHTA